MVVRRTYHCTVASIWWDTVAQARKGEIMLTWLCFLDNVQHLFSCGHNKIYSQQSVSFLHHVKLYWDFITLYSHWAMWILNAFWRRYFQFWKIVGSLYISWFEKISKQLTLFSFFFITYTSRTRLVKGGMNESL